MTKIPTLQETVAQIAGGLREYIEATYHIGNEAVIEKRRTLLNTPGVITQTPFLESTPRYTKGDRFSDLGLPAPATELLHLLATPNEDGSRLLYDPPYSHQSDALQLAVNDGRNLAVTTGTGSGKTESFLMPVLSRLAIEATDEPLSFQQPAIRALLLYPMNALVNDQLARLRLMLGDERVRDFFSSRGGRPARFARYTSRTLYPGVRTSSKDGDRLRPAIRDFYLRLEESAAGDGGQAEEDAGLIAELRRRGKWPAKADLRTWYGQDGTSWKNRAMLQPDDAELLTRHEVHESPPDVLVTNYSMLEYMLLRPLERPVFDKTRQWLANQPDQKLILVIDEAHLYRGAAGAEVAMLIRRLCARLDITPDRLQTICTSASFQSSGKAAEFSAQLTGTDPQKVEVLTGTLDKQPNERPASTAEAMKFASIDMESFYAARTDDDRFAVIDDLLREHDVKPTGRVEAALHQALSKFEPLNLLVNSTMEEALSLDELETVIFPDSPASVAGPALSALAALGSIARLAPGEAGLLPCRVHAFFRGLPGLWACPDAEAHGHEDATSPIGRLFEQPQDHCDECGARVFEYFTCRGCGASYLRGYVDNVADPSYLYQESGSTINSIDGLEIELAAVDVLIEEPADGHGGRWVGIDLVTGRIDPEHGSTRILSAVLPPVPDAADDEDGDRLDVGEFKPCGVCQVRGNFGRSTVQDHQTKGDQPFQAVVSRQLAAQPPSPTADEDFAPLRGRKVLLFSDSRQMAARLAPNLQQYSAADVVRPAVVVGWSELASQPGFEHDLTLEDLYLACVLGALRLGLRLPVDARVGEHFELPTIVAGSIAAGTPNFYRLQVEASRDNCPKSLMLQLFNTVCDRFYGLEPLALASLAVPAAAHDRIATLPALDDVAETDSDKVRFATHWIGLWRSLGVRFSAMDLTWASGDRRSGRVRTGTGKFPTPLRTVLDASGVKTFNKEWLPVLLDAFCRQVGNRNQYEILASKLTLDLSPTWTYCDFCRTTSRPRHSNAESCLQCGRNGLRTIDPDTDRTFQARKRYYRQPASDALRTGHTDVKSIIAAEHTAQLNSANQNDVFSTAERYELRFQDIKLPSDGYGAATAIDVLSCTTTMEVGIDIGSLSGVALRNMPPSRASYQQRAGRAGRRGNAIASVVAFGSSDTHDEHFFSAPKDMIRGEVVDPLLTLDNREIVRRHVTAYLLQRYHAERLPGFDDDQPHQLFEVLGSVADFRGSDAILNRTDFEAWLVENDASLLRSVEAWLPVELNEVDRQDLLANLIADTLSPIDLAIRSETDDARPARDESDSDPDEAPGEPREGSDRRRDVENLLDRLLYKGVLPRYAFPTDVASFHVFAENSDAYRHEHRYAPSQGLDVALSQYAPGKRVWIDGREWRSGAIYSPMDSERREAWNARELYLECARCGYAQTQTSGVERGESLPCPACAGDGEATLGVAMNWMRPPGFAHPIGEVEEISADDQPALSYATRAKLVASGPRAGEAWGWTAARLRAHYERRELLVSNTGPRQSGYDYCVACGRIEPSASPSEDLVQKHRRPAPHPKGNQCDGAARTRNLILGTKFETDVLLVSLLVEPPVTLQPNILGSQIALRTVADALTLAAVRRLELEPGELKAEFRPALSPLGPEGLEAEIFVYDTLAGGAGFSRRAADLGPALVDDALRILEGCPDGCDRSCYRCLRSFKNRFDHRLLDRHTGAMLLRYCLGGPPPEIADARLEAAYDRLAADLIRLKGDGVTVERNSSREIDGVGVVALPLLVRRGDDAVTVGIHPPLTTTLAPAHIDELHQVQFELPVIPVDELAIARHLPAATSKIARALGVA